LPACRTTRSRRASSPASTGPDTHVDSARAEGALAYRDDRGRAVLAVLDEIAACHRVPVGAVALAWLADQPTVTAPIASARTPEQLADLLPVLELHLTDDERRLLAHVSSLPVGPGGMSAKPPC
jgi:aryl-alcohol dehydrogenase-like predicted oxidoreductase